VSVQSQFFFEDLPSLRRSKTGQDTPQKFTLLIPEQTDLVKRNLSKDDYVEYYESNNSSVKELSSRFDVNDDE